MDISVTLLYILALAILIIVYFGTGFYIDTVISQFDKGNNQKMNMIACDCVIFILLFSFGVASELTVVNKARNYRPPPKNNLIFLDIDGVLNHNKTTHRTKVGTVGWEDGCVANLNKITDACPNTRIVFTSQWRIGKSLSQMKDIAKEMGITAEVIGVTPSFRSERPRQDEISAWLNVAGDTLGKFDGILILDDEYISNYSYLQVMTYWDKGGLTEDLVDKAILQLNSKLLETSGKTKLSPVEKVITNKIDFGGETYDSNPPMR